MNPHVERAPALDGKERLRALYEADERHDKKLLLAGGSLCDSEGQMLSMKAVHHVERHASSSGLPSKSYLPIAGHPGFCEAIQKLVWGKVHSTHTARLRTLQTPGGTAALRLAADTIRQVSVKHDKARVWMSDPTWGNHVLIFQAAGLEVRRFPYRATPQGPVALDFQALLAGIEEGRPSARER